MPDHILDEAIHIRLPKWLDPQGHGWLYASQPLVL